MLKIIKLLKIKTQPFNLFTSSYRFCSSNSPTSSSVLTHKLSYGQGGFCELRLRNPKLSYHVQFETIWEDYCLVQFDAKYSHVKVIEDGNKSVLTDQESDGNGEQIQSQTPIHIKFKIPQDYTINGQINGSISHLKNNISNKLRCYDTLIKLTGANRIFQFGSIQSPKYEIQAEKGAIDIKSLTFQNGKFLCNSFSAAKVLFSGDFSLKAYHLAAIRSVVTYGKAKSKIQSKYVQIQSISGAFNISSEKVKIDRLWASSNGINIKSKYIQKIGIETGTGTIQAEESIKQDSVTLGRLHKGKILRQSHNKLVII